MTSVLVTGAQGFIGRYLIAHYSPLSRATRSSASDDHGVNVKASRMRSAGALGMVSALAVRS
jgi:nucleoside-diphosphate-sugar epimerase